MQITSEPSYKIDWWAEHFAKTNDGYLTNLQKDKFANDVTPFKLQTYTSL